MECFRSEVGFRHYLVCDDHGWWCSQFLVLQWRFMNNLHRIRRRQGSFSSTHPSSVDQISTHPIECRDSSCHLFLNPPDENKCTHHHNQQQHSGWVVTISHKKALDVPRPLAPFHRVPRFGVSWVLDLLVYEDLSYSTLTVMCPIAHIMLLLISIRIKLASVR